MDKDLKLEIDRKNFIRAVQVAKSLGYDEKMIKGLQFQALWQMAALYRNASGMRILAQQYGFQKEELKDYLEDRASKEKENGNIKALSTCFDITTGKYFNFNEWLDFHTNKWKE